MPKAKGTELNARRTSRGLAEFDFRSGGDRLRGSVPIAVLGAVIDFLKRGDNAAADLLAFLKGDDTHPNLPRGVDAVPLRVFIREHYLPKVAKPKLKKSSYEAEVDQAGRLERVLGDLSLHELGPVEAQRYRALLLGREFANNTIKKDLHLLGRVLNYALETGCVREKRLLPVRGLPAVNRSAVWLRKADIVKLLRSTDFRTRRLILFLVTTGCRINEALEVKGSDINWKTATLWLPTEKRRGKSVTMRSHMRPLKMQSLGPRFRAMLRFLKPHPMSGYLFTASAEGSPMSSAWAEDLIAVAVKKADLSHLVPKEVIESGGIDHVIPHDLRRTYCNHRVISGATFHELRVELGQTHAASIQSYMDMAQHYDKSESIFWKNPRVHRADSDDGLPFRPHAAHDRHPMPSQSVKYLH